MTPAELEQRIDAGVAAAIADGWTICDGIYFVRADKACCALSACALDELERNELERNMSALPVAKIDTGRIIDRKLGISERDRVSFMSGFDNFNNREQYYVDKSLYDLGRRMRAKYIEAK